MKSNFGLVLLSIGLSFSSSQSDAAYASTNSFSRQAQSCTDNPSFTFLVNAPNGGKISVGCFYIKEDGISNEQLVKRYDRFCTDASNRNYSAHCPKSCGLCDGGCSDDPNTTFQALAPGGGQLTVGCEYIKENGITEIQLANRYRKWCTDAFGTNKSNSCELSCGTCTIDTFCEGDNVNYRFEVFLANGQTIYVPCEWIDEVGISAAQLRNRYNKHCLQNTLRAQKCCASCASAWNELDGTISPTTSPTIHPTAQPTMHPTNSPSMHPTAHPTIYPTLQPTMHPTLQPTMHPTAKPTTHPSAKPTPRPSAKPTILSKKSPKAPKRAMRTRKTRV